MQTLIKNILWVLAGVAVTACAKQHAYNVDGVRDKFCVPNRYPPQGVWFVPEDTAKTPHGFSFMGCKLLDETTQKTCALPDGLISANVMPLSVSVNQTWQQLKNAAVFRSVVDGPGVTYETDKKTGWLKVYNQKAWPEWLIWRRVAADRSGQTNSLEDSDELVMSCSGAAVFPGGSGGLGRPDEFVCERYVKGKSYALKYKFVSQVPIPANEEIDKRDGELFRQVDSWKCPD